MFMNGIEIGNKYKIIKLIGSGTFGKVYKAQNIETNEFVAVKEISKERLEGDNYLKQAFFKELEVMKLIESSNSVKLIEFLETEETLNIIMELCDSDLDNILRKKEDGFTEEELKIMLIQLNVILRKLNEKKVIHRDIKLKNILIKYDMNVPLINFIPKLCDFGFAKVLEGDITQTKLGTPATMAPEILKNEDYNSKCDLWSLGVIIYQLLFKCLPFPGRNDKDLLLKILKSKGVVIPEQYKNKISNELFDLIKKLLEKDKNKRISYEEYFQHKFFEGTSNKISNDNKNKISFEERFEEKIKIIDEFNFSLYKAQDKTTGNMVFIKEFPKNIIEGSTRNRELFNNEIQLLLNLKGKCFIQFIDHYITPFSYIIVIEYFEGKILYDFIQEKKGFSEEFIYNILNQLIPAFETLKNENIILNFLSCKSFAFKYFKSENDFQIKFFDYGILLLNTTEIERKNYFLSDIGMNFVPNQKTNILNLGIIVYKMLFDDYIYKFNENESAKETIEKQKIIKLNKKISKSLKHFLENTCHLEIEKRYDYNSLLNDSFIKGKGIIKNINSNINISIDNIIIEKVLEFMENKISCIVNYYTKIINEAEIRYLKQYSREISSCLMLSILEVKYICEFLKNKKYNEDEELHIIHIKNNDNNLNKIEYDYSFINFFKDPLNINKEDKIFEEFIKKYNELQSKLKYIFPLFLNKVNLDLETNNNLNLNKTNYSLGSIEKYFFKIFEEGLVEYSYNEFKNAKEIFNVSKYISEYIIFIHLFINLTKPNCHYSEIFKIFNNNQRINQGSFYLITFIGGIIKLFKNLKVIEENETSFEEKSFRSFIEFYPENIKLICECERKIIIP